MISVTNRHLANAKSARSRAVSLEEVLYALHGLRESAVVHRRLAHLRSARGNARVDAESVGATSLVAVAVGAVYGLEVEENDVAHGDGSGRLPGHLPLSFSRLETARQQRAVLLRRRVLVAAHTAVRAWYHLQTAVAAMQI